MNFHLFLVHLISKFVKGLEMLPVWLDYCETGPRTIGVGFIGPGQVSDHMGTVRNVGAGLLCVLNFMVRSVWTSNVTCRALMSSMWHRDSLE